MAVATDFYYAAKKKQLNAPQIFLDSEEEERRREDHGELTAMKDHHRDNHDSWSKAGNFYNIVQSGEGADEISRYAVGLSRTIIDAGISMINEGEPEASFKPLTPADWKINVLWDSLMKHVLNKSNWKAHQKLWTTDLHIFGASPLESYINPVIRRPGEEPGLFLIRLATTARVGLRHRSIWQTYRNPNVSDPDEVPSCAWEETLTRGQWVTKYANRADFKNTKKVPVASKYKLTYMANEIENTFRVYCLPFGKQEEAAYEEIPNDTELGIPVCEKRLTTVNTLGWCPMSFGIFNDQLTRDYKQHSLYGMGIPQLIEGMEMIMEGLFNMTVDNMRLKNTVPVGYQPYQGQTDFPDFENMNFLESGRVYHGRFEPQSLGIADLSSNTVMWEWINNLCIWLTGYNFQQLGGDTSKTAFEFAQRLKANSNRALARLKGLENGPLKRAFHMTLANTLSQITKEEWEQVTDLQAKDIKELLDSGEASTDDFSFENGKVKSKRFVEFFPVDNFSITEDFSTSKKRKLKTNSVSNTLQMSEKKGETSMVPAVKEYLFPRGDVAQMLAFSTEVMSKSMLGDLRVQNSEAINQVLNSGASLMQVIPDITPTMLYELWKQGAQNAGLDVEEAEEGKQQESEALKTVRGIVGKLEELNDPTSQQNLALQAAPAQGPPAQSGSLAEPEDAVSRITGGA